MCLKSHNSSLNAPSGYPGNRFATNNLSKLQVTTNLIHYEIAYAGPD